MLVLQADNKTWPQKSSIRKAPNRHQLVANIATNIKHQKGQNQLYSQGLPEVLWKFDLSGLITHWSGCTTSRIIHTEFPKQRVSREFAASVLKYFCRMTSCDSIQLCCDTNSASKWGARGQAGRLVPADTQQLSCSIRLMNPPPKNLAAVSTYKQTKELATHTLPRTYCTSQRWKGELMFLGPGNLVAL